MGEKVLVVDNEESTCTFIRTVLSTRGFEVSAAQTAKVSLELSQDTGFHLAFVDIAIRDLDARYLVKELKSRNDCLGLVIMGHHEHTTLIQEAMNLDVTDYIYKPLRAEEVYFKAKHALEMTKFKLNNFRALKGIEERNISLQKQNLLLARRIEESTKNLSKLYEDLKETYMRTIKALAHAIDARDHYTFSHSDNVTLYAEMIAKQMNVDMSYIEDIKDACQLHDLGKIGVHDSVLSKPGMLSPEEFEEIKLHSQKGAQILEPLKFLERVIDIVRHHHERWDGKGYPDGIKEEQIPLGARVMAVADSYDAMVSARPYRKVGLSKQEAVEEVKKNSGVQFDPKVVEAFLKIVDQF
ncbi:MAG: HD domain-containing phosphohydrolase [Candidatus Omnitrophota bacterium]